MDVDSLVGTAEGLQGIELFPEAGVGLMERGLGHVQSLYLVSFDNPSFKHLFSVEDSEYIQSFALCSVSGSPFVSVDIGRLANPSQNQVRSAEVNFEGKQLAQSSVTGQREVLGYGGYVGFAGRMSFYSRNERGQWLLRRGSEPICTGQPDSLLDIKNGYGWIEIARNTEATVFASQADRPGLVTRQFVICQSELGTWKVVAVDGADTRLSIKGGWLAGTVADIDWRTDFDRHRGYEPVYRETAVVINLKSFQPIYFHVGADCEVLAIDGNDVIWFRSGQGLYRGQLQGAELIDRQLVLTDPRMAHVHWAFAAAIKD